MPKPDELLFALKTYSGAMLAFYISCWLGLDNPYWSMATAFIVAHPFAGAMRSKALYRFFGTLIGGTAAVVMVPNLVNAPVLLCIAMALWVGLCLYIALMDRSPRAYTFMLSGYTAGIIGFPAVSDPSHIFQTALTRCEEITLGIVCTTLVGTLILPRSLGPVLARRISSWVKPAVEWASAALAGEGEAPPARDARRRLAFEATDTAMMVSQLAYDISHLQSAVQQVTRLRMYVISLMPILGSIGQRVAELRRIGGITPAMQAVLTRTDEWMQAGDAEGADPLLHDIQELEHEPPDWAGLLRASLAVRLEELVRIVYQSRRLRRHVTDGTPAPENPALEGEYIAIIRENRDHKLAFLSAFSAALAILLVCAIWIETAWAYGAGAAILVAVACSFFAAQDDPAPAIALMLRNGVIVIAGIFVFSFAILPVVTNFSELYLVLLPVGLLIGVLVSRPATFGTGMVIGAIGSTQLALNNGYNTDFIKFADSSFSLIVGLGSALILTRLIRSVGAAWSAERLMRANWRDVAAAAEASTPPDRAAMTGIMMDRLGLMMPRLAAVASGADSAAAGALTDLRVGLNMIGLHREQWRLPAAARAGSQLIFHRLAAFYRTDPRKPAPPGIIHALDETICALAGEALTYRETLMILSGLRSVLYPDAPPPDIALPVAELVAP
ncbi:MAG: FUSC family protein [Rhodospirillales bacterium]|nr:FUSC family protein [Rhodospirillales bacterium]MDE2318097.1 FUSC family protein [Rhodospirillales bacterium]